jgi:hypothetical protein
MKQIIRYTLGSLALLAISFSCKDGQVKISQKAEIPADILEAAEKWKKFESEADPLFLQALNHTDLGHDKFSFSKGNFFQYLYKTYQESLDNGTIKQLLSNNQDVQQLLPVFEKAVEDSGLLSWQASASSTMEERGGVYMNKYYLLCDKGYEDKLMFSFLGGEEKELSVLGRLPKNTALALSGTANVSVIVKYFDEIAKKHPKKLKDIVTQKGQAEAMSEMMGIDFNRFLGELSNGATLVITLSEKETLKLDDETEIPRPEIMLLMGRAGDETKKMISMFETQAKAQKEVVDEITFLVSPQKIPMFDSPAYIAYNDSEYVLGTDKNLISSYLKGETEASNELKSEFAGMPKKGNGFFYLSKTAVPKVMDIMLQNPQAQKSMDANTQKTMKAYADKMFFSGVYSLKPEGMTAYYRTAVGGTFNNDSMLLTTTAITGIGAAMVLPALGTARAKAQAKKVSNGLKQSGLGIMIFFSDGSEVVVPKDYHQGFEWELSFFEQPNLKFTPTSWGEVYSPTSPWKIFIKAGQKFSDIENPDYPVMAVPAMKSGDDLLVLYGDGHVETRLVPSWEEMSLERLQNSLK